MDETAWFRIAEIDSIGFLRREFPLSLAMKPVLFPDGVAVKVYERNNCGYPTKIENRDSSGFLTRNVHGIAITEFTYDSKGRATSWAFFDEQRNPVPNLSRGGAARQELRYREFDGKLIEQISYDLDGNRIESPD